jgi:hypothetical protein
MVRIMSPLPLGESEEQGKGWRPERPLTPALSRWGRESQQKTPRSRSTVDGLSVQYNDVIELRKRSKSPVHPPPSGRQEPPRSYTFDPNDPVPTIGGGAQNLMGGLPPAGSRCGAFLPCSVADYSEVTRIVETEYTPVPLLISHGLEEP